MADKSFGVRELNLTNTSGTPTVSSPNQLNLSAHTVAISTSVTVGQNLTVSANAGISSLNVTGIGTVLNLNVLGVGTITSPSDANAHSRWKVTNQSASAYRFTGPGQDGSENNPNVYLVRGQRYIFDVNASGHPFQLRVANGGAAYSDGVTNNGAQSGQVIFNVQHDAPAQLYYQCTNHSSMVGNIYIVGGPQVISGVVTATTFVGNLTGNPTGTLQTAAQPNITSVGTLSALTVSGNINLTSSDPTIVFADSDNNPDFDIKAGGGRFVVRDSTNNAERLRITSAGTAVFGGDTSTPIVDNGELFYRGNSTSTFGFPQNFYLYSDDIAYNGTNPGAGMLFGGAFDSGGNYTTYAGIHGIKENSTSANADGFLVFGTRQNGSGSWERLRIASNGQVCVGNGYVGGGGQLIIRGVGVNNYAVLDNQYVGTPSSGTTLSQIRFTANTTGSSVIGGARIQAAADGAWSASGDAPTRLQFYTAPDGSASQQERLRIASNGNVGINQTNPTSRFQVAIGTKTFNVSNTNGRVERGFSGGGNIDDDGMWFIDNDSTSGTYIRFWQTVGGAFQIGSISHGTSSTSYNTSSDYRLKENVVPISDGITRLKTLKPSRFNFKNETEKTLDGFLAHEVTAVPEAITGTKDEVSETDEPQLGYKKGDPIYQGIDQSKLVPLLTAALQEAVTKIEILESKVAALEGS